MGEFRVVTRSVEIVIENNSLLSSLKKKFFRKESFFDGENDISVKGKSLEAGLEDRCITGNLHAKSPRDRLDCSVCRLWKVGLAHSSL
jgi:hypothetical protein|nr:hypothetical protein [uncultured Acetatifactor sp.]